MGTKRTSCVAKGVGLLGILMKRPPPTSDRADAYFDYIRATNPPAFQVWCARNDDEFIRAVESALELYLGWIEGGARQYHGLSELGLSYTLSTFFRAGGVDSLPEPYVNGHVDLAITHPALKHLSMLGECKIYRSFTVHLGGCGQLLKRYMSGRFRRGFCLEFFKVPEMYVKLSELKVRFDREQPLSQQGLAVDHSIRGAFLTVHTHFTGVSAEILHLGCNVFHPDSTTPS